MIYVIMQAFVFHENMLAKEQRRKIGKINDGMGKITSGWFFLRWFQDDISMVSRNNEISCFTHKPIKIY